MGRGKNRKYILALAILLVLVGACALLLRYVFVVRNVIVQGDVDASDEEITRIASIQFGSSIFSVDPQAIESNVNATGLWRLDQVQLRYPDTVELTVGKRDRSAMLLHMGRIQVLDEQGCVVESLSEVPATDLIYLSGLNVMQCRTGEQLRTDAGQIEAYCAVMQELNAQGAAMYASEIQLSDPQDLRLITRNGITVLFGDAENMMDTVAWMKSAVADLESRGEGGGTLDVRSATKADYSRSSPGV